MEGAERAEELLLVLEDKLEKTASVLRESFANIRAGRANPHVLDKVLVDYYGAPTPVNQVGNIAVTDAKCITISPWEASMLKNIEKAILASNIGLNPVNDGKVIRLVFPDLTEERRRDLVKQVKQLSEEAKVAARNVRRETMDALKKMKTAKELSEDESAGYDKHVEKALDKRIQSTEKKAPDKVNVQMYVYRSHEDGITTRKCRATARPDAE